MVSARSSLPAGSMPEPASGDRLPLEVNPVVVDDAILQVNVRRNAARICAFEHGMSRFIVTPGFYLVRYCVPLKRPTVRHRTTIFQTIMSILLLAYAELLGNSSELGAFFIAYSRNGITRQLGGKYLDLKGQQKDGSQKEVAHAIPLFFSSGSALLP